MLGKGRRGEGGVLFHELWEGIRPPSRRGGREKQQQQQQQHEPHTLRSALTSQQNIYTQHLIGLQGCNIYTLISDSK